MRRNGSTGTLRRSVGSRLRIRVLALVLGALTGLMSGALPNTGSLASGNAGIKVAKTVDATSITPALSLTLAVDRQAAIPGDHLTYSGQVSNTGASLGMTGHFTAGSHANSVSTIAFYFDEVEFCEDGCGGGNPVWRPLAGFAAVQPGYTPVETPAVTTGLVLTPTPITASNVTYPTGGDPILGTQVGPSAVADWTYQATIALTPAQIATLSDPNQVQAVRNTIHMEVTPRNEEAAQPWTDSEVFADPFQAQPNPAALSAVTITVTAPSGPALIVDARSVPGLALLKPGDIVAWSVAYPVPVPAAKGAVESDSAYLARLTALEGTQLKASATAAGTASGATVSAPAPPQVSTTEHLPILGITKSGPTGLDAGSTETNPLALLNNGGAPASALTVSDSLPGGAAGTVSGLPAQLDPTATAGATASVPVPADQPPGSLTDTAALTWQDANGNAYGPVSSSFTTTIRNPLLGARLTLAPPAAGPDIVGGSQRLTASLVDRTGAAIAGQTVTFTVAGANPAGGSAVSDASGTAAFTYVGTNPGTDQVQATVHAASIALQSNSSSVGWIKPIQTISSTTVAGSFFHEDPANTIFVARPGDTPDFTQTFPTIDFNPLPGTVPHDISGVTSQKRPFTDLTTDANGNFNGTIVAQGSGVQAGVGTMNGFDAVFTGTYVVSQAGDLTLNLTVGDGFILGVGGGATRVSGDLINPPVPGTSVFQGYPVMAAFQQQSSANSRTATIHFPAPGSYPYEIDYFEAGGGDLSLVVTAASIVPQTSPLSIYVGYADGLRPAGSVFPFPWLGSPGVTFVGDTRSAFDSGALRFDNSGDSAITLDSVTVDLGPTHFDLWPRGLTVPAHQTLVLAQTNNQNFDTSDFPIQCNGNNGVIPVVNVTTGGVLTSYKDIHQVLNTGGIDSACHGNESIAWQRIAGSAAPINVPLPPSVSLNLSPFSVPGATVGLAQRLTVTAMDASGQPVVNQPLAIQVFGPNAQQLSATTDAAGLATFSYVGAAAGADQVQATGFVTGFRAVSNLATVTWTNPLQPGPSPQPSGGPPPSVTNVSPSDGSVVTRPVPVNATITPPTGQTIASWQVTYQAQDPGSVVTLASGTGAPPSPLATFDPTRLPNDSYQINVTAVASNDVTETLTTTVTVFGNLKPGRYVTTYQDLSVPVNGFQMQVRRRYDSIDRTQGDFGIGWRVDVANFRTAPNRVLGAGGWSMYDTSCFLGLCTVAFQSSAPHYVSVTFPDQHTEFFDFTPQGGTNVFWTATAAYTARPGTGTASTLAPIDSSALTYRGDGDLFDANGQVYDPQRFKLTTKDGRVLILDRTLGLVSETDRNGNSLSIDGLGIHASNGQSVTFTRDAAGRITQITDPAGHTLAYSYATAGDLATSTDAVGNTTIYGYDGNHGLLTATGPGGQALQSQRYDAGGRLVAVVDAGGNTTQVSNDVSGQKQTIVDPTGLLTTVLTLDDLGDVIRQDQVSGGEVLTTTFTYDPVGRPLSRTDPAGHTWTGAYDGAGNLTSLALPSTHTTAIAYDGNANVTSYADPLANATSYAYDAAGNLTSVTDATGAVRKSAYDAAGRPVSRTDAVGRRTAYAYDAAGNLTSVTDPRGSTTRKTYDGDGRVLTSTDALGRMTTNVYDASGNLLTMTDPLGNVTTYTYNSLGQMASSTDPAGGVTTYGYDAALRLATKTDPLGRTTAYAYDANSRLVSTTDPVRAVTSYAYDGFGRLAAVTEPLNRVMAYQYDAAGRLVAETMPNGGVARYIHDVDGRLVSETDPLNRTTTHAFDAAGRPTADTDPLGVTTSTTYDAVGRVIAETDGLGGVTAKSYDAAGQLQSETDQLGRVTTYAYDGSRNRTTVTDPLGRTTTSAYDGDKRLTAVTDPLGNTTSYGYDAAGHRVTTTRPAGGVTSDVYDPRGLLVSETDPLGRKTTFAYDAAGQRITQTDPLLHTTTSAYDGVGRLVSLTDALGGQVLFTHDPAGEVISTTNPAGAVITRTYDALGSVATETNPAGGVTTHTYDLAGQLLQTVDPRGVTVSSTYDAGGRLVGSAFPGGSVAYGYDAAGRRTSMVDPTGTTTYVYDAAGEVTSVASPQGSLTYAYDGAGRRTSMAMPNSRTVTYGYDGAGNLTQVQDWQGNKLSMSYNADASLTTVSRPNGVVSSYVRDAAQQVIGISTTGPPGPIEQDVYTYDAAGNRTSAGTSANHEQYLYDALNRLTQTTYGNGDIQSFTYDAAGNRTSETLNGVTTPYAYNGAGELVSAGSTPYAYDAAGNVVSAGQTGYGYDYAGRLTSVSLGGSTTTYAYNGDGVRVGTSTSATVTPYLVDQQASQPQVVSDGSSTYVHTDSGLVEQVTSAGTPTYPVADALGSIRLITDAAGAVAGTSGYDVFGAVRARSGTASIFGFTGEQADPTGLLFLRARYLDPSVGRFLSPDTVLPNAPGTQGYDLQAYVANNPTTAVDPTGRDDIVEYEEELTPAEQVAHLLEDAEDAYDEAECVEGAYRGLTTNESPLEALPDECELAAVFVRLYVQTLIALMSALNSTTSAPQMPVLGVGTGVAPVPEPTGGSANYEVDVRSKPVLWFPELGNHLFIIYTSPDGQFIFRGGPTRPIPLFWGPIKTCHGRYQDDGTDCARDYPKNGKNFPSVTALAGEAAHGKDACFTNQLQLIEQWQIQYKLSGPNSNSVVYTLLSKCHVPQVKPEVGPTPGWGMVLKPR